MTNNKQPKILMAKCPKCDKQYPVSGDKKYATHMPRIFCGRCLEKMQSMGGNNCVHGNDIMFNNRRAGI